MGRWWARRPPAVPRGGGEHGAGVGSDAADGAGPVLGGGRRPLRVACRMNASGLDSPTGHAPCSLDGPASGRAAPSPTRSTAGAGDERIGSYPSRSSDQGTTLGQAIVALDLPPSWSPWEGVMP